MSLNMHWMTRIAIGISVILIMHEIDHDLQISCCLFRGKVDVGRGYRKQRGKKWDRKRVIRHGEQRVSLSFYMRAP